MTSHSDVAERFARGDAATGSRMYSSGSRLYSYGQHFILAVHLAKPRDGVAFLLNGDTYSGSTSKHQNITRSACSPSVIIPFSALERAMSQSNFKGKFEDITIVDKTSEHTREVPYIDPKTGEPKTRTEHLLGSSLIRLGRHYWLSSSDAGAKGWGRGFFLVRLPNKVESIEEAYESLRPTEVTDETPFVRQGEFFFVPTKERTIDLKKRAPKQRQKLVTEGEAWFDAARIDASREDAWDIVDWWIDHQELVEEIEEKVVCEYEEGGKTWLHAASLTTEQKDSIGKPRKDHNARGQILKQRNLATIFNPSMSGNTHLARDLLVVKKGEVYARGTIRHPEHRTINLGETWHRVYINRARDSFSVSGVD